MRFTSVLSFIVIMLLISCQNKNPNLNEKGQDELSARTIDTPIQQSEVAFDGTYYVPIYSDIYFGDNIPKELLAATLSLRNTSFIDTLFISTIDYYNTDGALVKSFIDQQIAIAPMATVNYVIDRDDDSGGSGAHFVVNIHARSQKVKPLVQAIMVGEYSSKAFAFESDGYIIAQTEGD